MLYEPLTDAPQLENAGRWTADPLMVSGADAYVDGEYLFQDFIYDDKGANTTATPLPPAPRPDHHDFGPMTGDVVYPTDRETYAHNAADLLEFRVRLARGDTAVAYRIALNTMLAPDVAAVAVGINTDGSTDTGTDDWGYGIGSLGELGLDHVLVTWGTGAELDGEALPSDDMGVSVGRNQLDVEVPLSPEGETWRHYLVIGLWDDDARRFKPIGEQPSENQPGGAHGKRPPPVFNVGFRSNDQEPLGTPNLEPETLERQVEEAIEGRTGSRGVGYGHWREHAQANALADRDISRFHADIDFDKLARRETEYNVPTTGYVNRIYASHYALGAGIGPYVTEEGDDNNGEDVLLGNLQPYSLYVPDGYDSDKAIPFHVHLHSLSGTYNQYASFTPNFLRQVGESRDTAGGEQRGTIIMTTTGRGPGVPYDDQAELDTFEAWADAAAHYNLDFDRVTLGGYSMGGIGTHRLASKWPDLFAKGFPIAGSIGGEYTDQAFGDDLYKNQELIAINQRHVPLLMWQGSNDELVPLPLALKYEQKLRDLGLRHEFDVFLGYEHLTFGYLDEWAPAAEFLSGATVERTPPRVTYRRVPRLDNRNLDLVHDGVYWVSDIRVTDDAAYGLVDVRSLGFGEAPPVVTRYERPGTEPNPHVKRGVEWKDALVDPAPENALDVELTDVTAVTLWVDEAELDATEPIELAVETNRETVITLASACGRERVTVPAGETETVVHICGGRP